MFTTLTMFTTLPIPDSRFPIPSKVCYKILKICYNKAFFVVN
ncbi:hypothetical protein [Moorena producens]